MSIIHTCDRGDTEFLFLELFEMNIKLTHLNLFQQHPTPFNKVYMLHSPTIGEVGQILFRRA